MAASVANLKLLIFDIAGSTTPAARLSRIVPFTKSSPMNFNPSSAAFSLCYPLACTDRSLATNSDASFAAFTANVLGITNNASAYSEITICSRESMVLA